MNRPVGIDLDRVAFAASVGAHSDLNPHLRVWTEGEGAEDLRAFVDIDGIDGSKIKTFRYELILVPIGDDDG